MALVRFEPFREVAALQNEMGRLLGLMGVVGAGTGTGTGNGNGHSTWLPALDATETETELVLSFDLPGLKEDDISIELEDNVLTVSGKRERKEEETKEGFYRMERRFGEFS